MPPPLVNQSRRRAHDGRPRSRGAHPWVATVRLSGLGRGVACDGVPAPAARGWPWYSTQPDRARLGHRSRVLCVDRTHRPRRQAQVLAQRKRWAVHLRETGVFDDRHGTRGLHDAVERSGRAGWPGVLPQRGHEADEVADAGRGARRARSRFTGGRRGCGESGGRGCGSVIEGRATPFIGKSGRDDQFLHKNVVRVARRSAGRFFAIARRRERHIGAPVGRSEPFGGW
mmetsp:Transcript_3762/g.12671  ORF Transcript_3762/g.12671 Transcript_3762/m.12671 type:complete len:228 (-) Transcript_3762:905-1588(-)